ncbi:TetR/AcrR family transcriptional regulator [Companilactobacillus nantensis]|uniref:TetR family transcriptional regulator n=1 Tax=Companilactobacillus nantensis DSM 16982 TaxID=1423774 RepID=A0A0R1WDW8_9LACO|nr:TetR/AcrR family transcriptional regulator [Companilactobacillus nantensis]KRM15805.1 TetR family transcriptional regulator [Companilactobacillus nantensis DSM 16982]GEO64589.1 TetR family transcriptional regulator [Companilactobacillus nantensis]
MTNNLKRKKDKKQAILDAALKILTTQGYKKASVAEIAKEANSSQVTLYKYFPSKIALARAVIIKQIVDGYKASEDALNSSNATFAEKMEMMMSYGLNVSDSISDDFVVFMYDEFSGKNGDDSVKKTYNEYKHGFWKRLLDQGRREGAVSPDITEEGAIIYLDMFVNYAMTPNPVNAHSAVEIKNHEKDLMHLFFYGIMGR